MTIPTFEMTEVVENSDIRVQFVGMHNRCTSFVSLCMYGRHIFVCNMNSHVAIQHYF